MDIEKECERMGQRILETEARIEKRRIQARKAKERIKEWREEQALEALACRNMTDQEFRCFLWEMRKDSFLETEEGSDDEDLDEGADPCLVPAGGS